MLFFIITILGLYFFFAGNLYSSVLIFFFLLTDGFQLIPPPLMLFGAGLYGKDYALVYLLAIFFSYIICGKIKPVIHLSVVHFSLTLLIAFLLISFVIDLTINHTKIGDFLLMTRHYWFLTAFLVIQKIPKEVFYRVGSFLMKLTIFQSFLCLLQIPLKVQLLTMGGVGEYNEMGLSWIRYTNLPYFINFFFFYVLTRPQSKIPYKIPIMTLFLCTIVFTLTRTLMLGIIITLAVGVLFGLIKIPAKAIIPLIIFIALLLPVIGIRLASSFKDIGSLNSVSTDIDPLDKEMTFTWRMALTLERANYVASNPRFRIFGIGFIHERSWPAGFFKIGLYNFDDGSILQLEQGDIAWANLFLRLGFWGTFLYLIFYFSYLRFFYKMRKTSLGVAAFLFAIYSLILSFAGGAFSFFDFLIIPFVLYHLLKFELTEQHKAVY